MRENIDLATPGMLNLYSQVKLSNHTNKPLFSKYAKGSINIVQKNGGRMFGKLFRITSYKLLH